MVEGECYEQGHDNLDRMAERITLLGGVPTCHPEALIRRSFLAHEPQGVYAVATMLQHDLRAEREVFEAYLKYPHLPLLEGEGVLQ